MCPVRLNHSALHAWNGNPAVYWSLHGLLASHIPLSIGNPGTRPRASIQKAAPYVHQLRTVSTVPASTARRASGSSGGVALTRRPSQAAVGRHASAPIVTTATRLAAARRSGGALCGAAAATTATPLPSDTAWITNADAAAGPGWTPARCARTTRPATLHTLPGT